MALEQSFRLSTRNPGDTKIPSRLPAEWVERRVYMDTLASALAAIAEACKSGRVDLANSFQFTLTLDLCV